MRRRIATSIASAPRNGGAANRTGWEADKRGRPVMGHAASVGRGCHCLGLQGCWIMDQVLSP